MWRASQAFPRKRFVHCFTSRFGGDHRVRKPFTQFNGYICACGHSPKCRHDHRLKQQPGWKVDQLPDAAFRWTTPSGRSYHTEPTRYPT